jgi:hypothetical protein
MPDFTVIATMSSVIALTAVTGLMKTDPVSCAVMAVLFVVLSEGCRFGKSVASNEYKISSTASLRARHSGYPAYHIIIISVTILLLSESSESVFK